MERTLEIQPLKRQERWSQAIAIGSKKFVEGFGESLGEKMKGRLLETEDGFEIREPSPHYGTCEGSPHYLEGDNSFP
ncbi:hypothetical protein WDW89_22495 [Deltaproteobacteria bacterium TL4]